MPRSSSLLGALLLIVTPTSCGGDVDAPSSALPPCPAYEPVIIGGQPTGLQRCTDGSVTRSEVLTCPSLPSSTAAQCSTEPTSSCHQDSECTAQPAGHCGLSEGGDAAGCHCRYGCLQDGDCGAGQLCRCGAPVGQCVAATCTTDADCPAGRRCAEYGNAQNPCSKRGFACTTASDSCAGDSCLAQPDPSSAAICRPDPGGVWGCVTEPVCVSGRLLVVERTSRQATLRRASDWG